MEGLREEVEDLLWSAQVVEDDVMRQDVERLDQLKDRHPQIFFVLMLVVFYASTLYFLPIVVIFRAVDAWSMHRCVSYLSSLGCRDAE